MRVLLDTSSTVFYAGGISVYTEQLVSARTIFAECGIDLHLINLPQLWHPPTQRNLRRKLSVLAWESVYMQGIVPFQAQLQTMHAIHAPGIRFPLTARIPVVVTIYDIIPILHPELFPKRGAIILSVYLHLMRRFARTVIVISEATKRDVQTYLRIPSEQIVVTPLGVNPIFQPQSPTIIAMVRERLGIRWPYLLCVGNIEPRKNIVRLIEAFAIIRRHGWPHHLIVVGKGGPLSGPIYQASVRLGLTDFVHFTGFIDNHDLAALYAGADAFVYPSLYEGFGLPVIEAMACGCPVVTSNVASLPEVGGEVAIYANPHDVASIATAIEQVLAAPDYTDTLRNRGILHAQQFTWERCVALTAQAYHHALQS
ncbi:MAG: glycosyl transferase family 1 [Patescibacteria group bacterium]|uniref:glycosyltransferase family 4 protein n=1 Tax=Chloroflexus sp. TaxID=1904827 RepID=UPI0021DBEFF5|nr:glycosyltransferase family 1 protein [Chloroflexus sp.]GIV91225.1 MAG: glycosyl transferase family 1 [Chloroflexus sp.]GIW61104.1 MAG: glycosyl transferase family 1 [Patescibacteria group bacterium]